MSTQPEEDLARDVVADAFLTMQRAGCSPGVVIAGFLFAAVAIARHVGFSRDEFRDFALEVFDDSGASIRTGEKN